MKYLPVYLCLLILAGCHQKARPISTGLEGKPLPSFSVLLSDSTTFNNASLSLVNKPILIFYFSPRCPYCRAELKEILNDNRVMGKTEICLITAFPFSEMKQFNNEFNLSHYKNIKLGIDYKYSAMAYFNPSGVPFLAVYNKEKILKEVFQGQIDTKDIDENIFE